MNSSSETTEEVKEGEGRVGVNVVIGVSFPSQPTQLRPAGNGWILTNTSLVFDEMNPRFDDLEIFLVVHRTGSLSAAARALRRSPSAVTRGLERLESDLGARLFHRSTRSMALTEEGRRFVPHAEGLRAGLARAEADLGQSAERVQGKLRLTVSATFARLYMAPVVAELRELHPALELELLLTDEVVNLIDAGLDAGIRIGPLSDSSLSAARLSTDRRRVVASPALLARVGIPQKPSDLSGCPCLTIAGRDRWTFRGGEEVRVDGMLNTNLGDFLLVGARSGIGFAYLADWLTGPSLREGALVSVLEPHTATEDSFVSIVTPNRLGRPARVEALLAVARRHFVPPPWRRL